MKRFFALAIALSFFLLFMPVSVCAIADDSDDASFYLNYWVEEHTGIDMKDIPVTAYGMSYADYIYRQTGYTVDYWVNNATDPSNFGENTDDYLNNTLYNDGELLKDLLSTTPITNTTSQIYGTNYNERVNSDGDINVSGSDYWNSVYNGISQNGYKDQYAQTPNDSYNTSINNVNYTFSKYGVYYIAGNVVADAPISGTRDSVDPPFILNNGKKNGDAIVSYSGGYLKLLGNPYAVSDFTINSITYDDSQNAYYVLWTMERSNGELYDCSCYLYLNTGFNGSSVSSGGSSVLQPKQVGYVYHNGIKYPVFTDHSLNPFTTNDDGTVTWDDGTGDEDIYIDTKELSPEGDQYLIQYIINNYYGDDHNDFDPFSSDPNNRLNYPDSNTKDYTDGINSIISWLKKIYYKETDIIKYLKQIAKGIPLSDDNDSEDEEDKYDSFESMLKLFNGSNNDGFKQKILEKIGYSGITQNINNFGMALFGSRTFNDDGTVNTQFGSNSVTETPTLYYTYAGVTHNFWNDLQLINQNGDLTRAKEYVRFFIIFGFFLSLFRSLPSLINNAGGILSHASLAVPVDQSENSIELTEINQILGDAPYPDEF